MALAMLRSLLLVLLLSLPGCAGLLNATVPTGGLAITRDLPYGDGPRETLDVYRLAAPAAPRPVVVFLYGGSWRTGSKDIYLFAAAALARRGAVVVVPDYRLYPQVRYPGFLDDCARAVAWVQAHAAGLGGDPRRVIVMGHSAGAYNAAMLATDPDFLAVSGGSRADLAGFIGLSGPYDFLPITDPDIVPIFPRDDPATMPVNHVGPGLPPMLLLVGAADRTVRPRNTYSLAEHARAAGDRVDVRTYPGTGHIGIILDLTPPFRGRAPVLDDIAAWISRLPPSPGPGPAAAGAAPRTTATPAG